MGKLKVHLLDKNMGSVVTLRVNPDLIASANTIQYKGVTYAYQSMPRFAHFEVNFQEVNPVVVLPDDTEVA